MPLARRYSRQSGSVSASGPYSAAAGSSAISVPARAGSMRAAMTMITAAKANTIITPK